MLFRYEADSKGRPVRKAVIYTKDEHSIPLGKIDPDALRIVTRLRDYGFDSYIVGGAVRDLLVGKEPKDFDVVTDATPAKIKKIFRNSRIIGKRFRLVHVFFGPKIFEVSTFRSISTGTVGNSFGTIDEDVRRRDFTLNALYYDPLREQVIDYVGGVRDIRRGVIRPVIPLGSIFEDDPVRMLRAVKYAATTGCAMPYSLRRKIRRSAHLLSPVSPSRLTEELLKIINSGHAHDIVRLAMDTGLYMYLQPAATSMIYADRLFAKKYFIRLRELDGFHARQPDSRLGHKLVFLIQDFMAGLTDWKKETAGSYAFGELYAKVWGQCRGFVLPMNPQRSELEFAIRAVLKGLGVSLQQPRKKAASARARENAAEGNTARRQAGKRRPRRRGAGGVSAPVHAPAAAPGTVV